MSALFEASVIDVSDRQVRLRVQIVNTDVRRLWTTKGFALSFLLEPIFFGDVALPEALAAVISAQEIADFDTKLLAKRASKVVTLCAIESVEPVSIPAHSELMASMSSKEIQDYIVDRERTPRAVLRIRVKDAGMLAHLTPGMRWDSAACDMI